MLYCWIQLLNLHTEKNIKKIKIEKWIFGRFLFYLFFIFLFFSKNFFIFEKFEKLFQILKGRDNTYSKIQQIWASSTNGGPGGRQAPPASKCHKKNVGHGGSHHMPQIV